MASESPYENLGGPLGSDPPDRAVSVRFGVDTPFSLAHRGTGEWRNWRAILDLNEITNPFDVGERASSGPVTTAAEPDDLDGTDVFDELGQVLGFAYLSSAAPEAFTLYVEDTDEGFLITASAEGVAEGDSFFLSPESVYGKETVSLFAYVGAETVEIVMPSAAWLLLWLHRTLNVTASFAQTRTLAILPPA